MVWGLGRGKELWGGGWGGGRGGGGGGGGQGYLGDAVAGRQVLRANGDLDWIAQELSRQLLNGGGPCG